MWCVLHNWQCMFHGLRLVADLEVFVGVGVKVALPYSGVDTEKIDKGRICWAGKAIWRVFSEILPLSKSKDKTQKNKNNQRTTQNNLQNNR